MIHAALAATIVATLAAAPKVGDTPPSIDAPDFAGQQVTWKSLEGKVVLLDFWATWCAPCKRSLPEYQKLSDKYGARGFVVLAISIDDELENAKRFVADNGLKLRFVHDAAKTIVSRYEPPKMPTAWLVDRKGTVRAVYAGFDADELGSMVKEIEGLLGTAE